MFLIEKHQNSLRLSLKFKNKIILEYNFDNIFSNYKYIIFKIFFKNKVLVKKK